MIAGPATREGDDTCVLKRVMSRAGLVFRRSVTKPEIRRLNGEKSGLIRQMSGRAIASRLLIRLECAIDRIEYARDLRPQQGESRHDGQGDKHDNQRILDKALAPRSLDNARPQGAAPQLERAPALPYTTSPTTPLNRIAPRTPTRRAARQSAPFCPPRRSHVH
jgi:hypothetical protein